MLTALRICLALFALFWLLPLGISAVRYRLDNTITNWRTADRSSTGLLPPPAQHPAAIVRIFAAPTVRWRSIFASHTWIVFKPENATSYTRYDYTAWSEFPIRINGFEPDGKWFGRTPQTVFAADGDAATPLIPKIRNGIATYRWRNPGDYGVWPGPNSNTFIAAIVDAIPEAQIALPSTAIGKDFPYDGRWLRPSPSRTGIRLSLGGYAGITIGWVEGIEINILAGVAGIDIRHPAIKLPGLGRIGFAPAPPTAPSLPPAALPAQS